MGKPIRFRLNADDLRGFVAAVTRDVPQGVPIQAIMEPTGIAWFPVASWLQRAGVDVIRVKGQRVKALRQYLSEHAKTDLADAHVLGALPNFGGRVLDPVHVPGPDQHALQRLTKQRHRYQEQICASRRRLLDLIRWACPALEPILPDTTTRLTLAILAEFFDPHRVLKTRHTTLIRFIGQNASRNHPHSGPFVENLAQALLKSSSARGQPSPCTAIGWTSSRCNSKYVRRSSCSDCSIAASPLWSSRSKSATSASTPPTPCVRSPASARPSHRCWSVSCTGRSLPQ